MSLLLLQRIFSVTCLQRYARTAGSLRFLSRSDTKKRRLGGRVYRAPGRGKTARLPSSTPASSGWKASSQRGAIRSIARAGCRTELQAIKRGVECTLAQIDLRIMLDRRHDAVVIFCLIGITVATRSPAESGAL